MRLESLCNCPPTRVAGSQSMKPTVSSMLAMPQPVWYRLPGTPMKVLMLYCELA